VTTKAVGSTRVPRVQFGVPPNWIGGRTTGVDCTKQGQTSSADGFGRDARNNPRDAGATTFFLCAMESWRLIFVSRLLWRVGDDAGAAFVGEI
jgi:hypothetical protein